MSADRRFTCKDRRLQTKSVGYQHWMREQASYSSSSCGMSSGHLDIFTLDGQRMHQFSGNKYHYVGFHREMHVTQSRWSQGFSIRVMSAKPPPPFWLPYIFSKPAQHRAIRRGSQTRRALGRPGSPHAPQCFHFPVLHTSLFSAKKGIQEVTWELNTTPGYNTSKSVLRPGCLLLWQCSALEKSRSLSSVETELKSIRDSLKRKGIKLCISV